jgi:hypothetical protein
MTAWDILDKVISTLPPVAAVLFFLALGVIFAVGFARHGLNFLKYGFQQKEVGDLSKKIDDLRGEFHTELETIKVNHFGHLKNYLTELNGILLDKNVINNQDKARLDNQLRGM